MSMFKHIREEIKPDLIFWGGDSIAHNLDTLSLKENVLIMKNVSKLVLDELKDFKVYPAVGNHDTYP